MTDSIVLQADTLTAIVDTLKAVSDTVVAGGANEEISMSRKMMMLVLQIGVLIFAAYVGGKVAALVRMPSVLGELLAGVVVGPYVLGSLPVFNIFEHGIFQMSAPLSVSPELYGFATIASIILLFMTGLETDISMFLRYSVAGAIVGIGGVICSLIAGMAIGPIFYGEAFTSSLSLFLGVLCTATSVGITARILSDKRKIDSSEGVTILAGAVIDDVLGIICLAVLIGIVDARECGSDPSWIGVSLIGLKAVVVWLAFTAIGLLFAHKISAFLKKYFKTDFIMTAALGLSFVLAAVFEISGLAMIIGAYVMGLSLSRTDLKFMLMERLHGLYTLFVPVFFATMGALIDVTKFLEPKILLVGLIYGVLACFAKVIGCGTPTLLLGFNWRGALRIGAGMIPRGEVALIIAGLGVARGILAPEFFGIAILMTLFNDIISPPIFSAFLDMKGRGTRAEAAKSDSVVTVFDLKQPILIDMVTEKLSTTFTQEGFFITRMDLEGGIFQIRKDDVAFSMQVTSDQIVFQSAPDQIFYIKTAVYETLIEFQHSINVLKEFNEPDEIRRQLADAVKDSTRSVIDTTPLEEAIRIDCIRMKIHETQNKTSAIRELVDVLGDSGIISDRDQIFNDVLEREKQVSTGLQDGIAIPHTKSDEVTNPHIVIGLCPEGMDFDALDGKPTTLIILLISPKQQASAHLQILATLGSISITQGFMTRLMSAQNTHEVRNIFLQPNAKK